jgi:hypothetical protein
VTLGALVVAGIALILYPLTKLDPGVSSGVLYILGALLLTRSSRTGSCPRPWPAAGRLPPEIEAPAYFVVAEALTNVAKHARASSVAVSAGVEDGVLRLEVRDDRLAALDGTLCVERPEGMGTVITAAIPVRARERGPRGATPAPAGAEPPVAAATR